MFWMLKIATLREYPYTKELIIIFSQGTVFQCGPSHPVSSVFWPLFPICNFAFINICYTKEYVVLNILSSVGNGK